jgi:hypothetical protein
MMSPTRPVSGLSTNYLPSLIFTKMSPQAGPPKESKLTDKLRGKTRSCTSKFIGRPP